MKGNYNEKFIDLCIKIFTWIFLIGFLWVFCNCIFRNSNDLIHYNMREIVPVSIVFLIIIVIISVGIHKSFFKNSFLRKNKKILFIISFLIIFAVQIFLAYETYYKCGWDVSILTKCGKALVDDIKAFDINYFLQFPNNILLLWIYKKIYVLSNLLGVISYEFMLIIVNIILIDLSVFFGCLTAKKLIDNMALVITYILSLMILMFSPWIVVPYSDSFSMLFPILNIFLYLKVYECRKDRDRYLLAVLIGVISIVGFQIKPTTIISLIAIFIGTILNKLKNMKNIKRCLVIGFCIIVSASFTKFVYNKTIYNMEVEGIRLNSNEDAQIPMTHFLMMGLNRSEAEGRGILYGAWRKEDYDITNSCDTKKEKIQTNLDEYKDRVKKLGIQGYLKYLSEKGNWMLADGTFYYGGEGVFALSKPYTYNKVASFLQFYYYYGSEGYTKLAYLEQAVWSLILFLIVIPIFLKDKGSNNRVIFIVRLSIVGIVMFLLLFEGRSRYFLNHLLVFIVLASYGLTRILKKYKVY